MMLGRIRDLAARCLAAAGALTATRGGDLNARLFLRAVASGEKDTLSGSEERYLVRLAARAGIEILQDVPVNACFSSPDARPVLPIKVEELARSISLVGLRNPISVRLQGDGYEIRGGGHRHAAFVRLGRETIPAFVRDDDDLHAELAEIDENLVRNELGPAERALAFARRKALYETLHPETRHGTPGVSRQVGDTQERASAERFTRATAEATGASERTVQREAERGERIGAAALRSVAGTALDKGEELDALARLPEERRDALISRAAAGERVSAKVELKKAVRETREADLGTRQRALPQRRYGVILADPEWRFEPWSRETGLDRSADNHYPTSELEEIKARRVADIAAEDSVLFLWATAPMLPQALEVMSAWGFTYRSHVIWRKSEGAGAGLVLGNGYWFRNGHELLLVGARGNVPAPAMGTQFPSVVDAPPRRHSEKPDWQYELAERHFPTLPKIELNARRARPGWDAWGLEAPGADAGRNGSAGRAGEPPEEEGPVRDTGQRRRTPAGQPTVSDIVRPGSIVRTSYGTGPYRVIEVEGPYDGQDAPHYSLGLRHVNNPGRKADAWVNELVAVDGRLLKLMLANQDEVLLIADAAEVAA